MRTHLQIVATITRKKFLNEMDLLRLQKALLMCRMVADSTTLVDKEDPGLLDQAGPPRGAFRADLRGGGTQGHPVLGVDDNAQPDRASAQETGAWVCAA